MHPNAALLHRLFSALDAHDHAVMASCYHEKAKFRDIAFCLQGSKEIQSMWRMICHGDIRATYNVVNVSDHDGQVFLIDTYMFGSTADKPGRPVRNFVESRFRFQDGQISEHLDLCDARAWAEMAIGGPLGFLAGRLRFPRSWKAKRLLRTFVAEKPR